ncbi:MAG: NrfD/PsrC family molybdoenzyme membrane anchor subunit [Armatimonadota bacterium]|nr:NrfD/PsrC family molybdoenzyme membrane anchor subunit [Armatimonadota bacterium]MDR7518739.1 NrfD/PsrC family molybdoenzyme membrane anchor subunit [Armatimonadota bacterium]MDR7550013.1 NrfD/PsrC family molybdoenzyme membrane anchor subunit [Armatimonadota bacterium]
MKRVFWVLWAAAFVAGLAGVVERLVSGHELAAYGSYVPWGLWVAVYIYFVGLSAGAFLLSTVIYVFGVKRLEPVGRLALFTALVTLLVALFSIWFDLGHMSRFWRVYTSRAWTSMMAWMVWLYTAYFLLLLVEMWFAVRADLARRSGEPTFLGRLARLLTLGQADLSPAAMDRDRRMVRLLATVGVPLATAFHGGVGALFGVIGARLFWHATIYPLLFLSSALASGSALLTFLTAFWGPGRGTREHRELVTLLATISLGLLVLDLLFEFAEFSISLYATIPAAVQGFLLVLFGPYWWVFWLVHVALGALAPIVILAVRRHHPTWAGVATFLIAATFIAVRLNIVIPGLAYPEIQGLERAYIDHRLTFRYFPSLLEWQVTAFVTSLGIALFALGLRVLPIVTVHPREA